MAHAADFAQRLSEASLIYLTTYTSDGKPGTVPVWYAYHDGKLSITTMKTSKKVQKIRQNSLVRVAVGEEKTPKFLGAAKIIEDSEGFAKALTRLSEKYNQYWGTLTEEKLEQLRKDRVILEIVVSLSELDQI